MKNQSRIYKPLLGVALIAELVCFALVFIENSKLQKLSLQGNIMRTYKKTPNDGKLRFGAMGQDGTQALLYFQLGSIEQGKRDLTTQESKTFKKFCDELERCIIEKDYKHLPDGEDVRKIWQK